MYLQNSHSRIIKMSLGLALAFIDEQSFTFGHRGDAFVLTLLQNISLHLSCWTTQR